MNNTTPTDVAAAFAAVMMLLPLLMIAFLIFSQGFWIWMLVDSATNKRLIGNDKLVWVLVVVFTNWIGALVYFFAGRRKGSAASPPPPPSRSMAHRSPPPLCRQREGWRDLTSDAPAPVPVTCTNCGHSSAYKDFGVDVEGRGSCPKCSVHVVFE